MSFHNLEISSIYVISLPQGYKAKQDVFGNILLVVALCTCLLSSLQEVKVMSMFTIPHVQLFLLSYQYEPRNTAQYSLLFRFIRHFTCHLFTQVFNKTDSFMLPVAATLQFVTDCSWCTERRCHSLLLVLSVTYTVLVELLVYKIVPDCFLK